jgi:glycosyltransferase involved in cell wall biosynthesis
MAPFVGGAEVAAERLAVGLRDVGHDVVLLVGRRGAVLERLERAGLRCIVSPMYLTDKWHWPRYWRARRDLTRLLRQERPDIVHSNDLPTHQIVSDASRRLGIPRLCHHRFPFDGRAIDWLNKYGAERHLFISRSLMEDMCARSARLAASAWSVVYDGLPLPHRPDLDRRQDARRRLGLPTDRLIVTFAGQIIPIKGVADLLRAWATLSTKWACRAELVIVGEDMQAGGAYREEMQRLARDLHCPARFVGFQNNVADWLLASDVAVVPSHVEPLGLVVLEAMVQLLPVVGSAVGGIRETVVPEETGLLVPPQCPEQLAAALDRCLRDDDMRRRLGEQGRRRCEHLFSIDAHTRAVLAEYHVVLTRADGKHGS